MGPEEMCDTLDSMPLDTEPKRPKSSPFAEKGEEVMMLFFT